MAADAEALDADALVEHGAEVAQAAAVAGVVLRDLPADGHARIGVEVQQYGVEDVAADVVEVDVDALGSGLGERRPDGARLVVDAGVEAEIGDDVAALLGPAGDADGAAALDARDLADGAADGAGRRRDDDRLAVPDAGDVDEADHGGGARLADEAEAEGERLQVGRQLAQALAVEDDVLAPAELALHGVARLEIGMAALDHDAGAAADHDVADLQGIGVLAVAAAHLPAHVGIDRQVVRAHQHLAVGGPRDRCLDEAEAARLRHAVRRLDVDELAMCRHGECTPWFLAINPLAIVGDDDTAGLPWEDASQPAPRNRRHQRKPRPWRQSAASTPAPNNCCARSGMGWRR